MAKVWNPGARRETVGMFVRAWCVQGAGEWTMADSLFGAYEVFCRHYREKDLTRGEFIDEMEALGFPIGGRDGAHMFAGISLTYMEDALIARQYGPQPPDR